MSTRSWSNVSYLDAIRPDPGWRTDIALLASYSADLVALVAALLALRGVDDDRGTGSKVDFVNAVEQLANRVRLIVQRGRIVAPGKSPKILAILDRYVREVAVDEARASWHPKAALAKHVCDNTSSAQWRLWIGSRNLTRDLSWDVGLSLRGQVGGPGTVITGIEELGHELASRGQLPRTPAATVRSELRNVRWELPSGCHIRSLRLLTEGPSRGIPSEPEQVRRITVVSPFLDGTVVGRLGKWGSDETRRTLLSTRSELAKLAAQVGHPLSGYQELLFLDAPEPDALAAASDSDRESAGSQDEEPEPRGLHAKLIYVEAAEDRVVWTGSANATRRGWEGPNTEVVAELEISRDVAAGLDDFIKSASMVQLTELGEPIQVDRIEERLEAARKIVAGQWSVTQTLDEAGPFLVAECPPDTGDPEIRLHVGLLAGELIVWPAGTSQIRLPAVSAGEVTELVCCRLTLGASSISWLQRAPLDPPPSEDRDRQAIARYLDPRTFLLWIRSLLTGDLHGDGGGDWDDESHGKRRRAAAKAARTWWAPTVEEILKSWCRDETSLVSIDRRVGHYLTLYKEQTAADHSAQDRAVVDEFQRTWQVLRSELVRGLA
ncbi:MAG: phospholipase D family protein [Pirellulaceae bacterium]|nr:phospholipase D family protein [Pirellulaceae bacterium]